MTLQHIGDYSMPVPESNAWKPKKQEQQLATPPRWPDPCTLYSGASSPTPQGVWSDSSFSSVFESSGCSTETESNEDDDFMAGLAEQMAHSMLDDDEDEDSDEIIDEISEGSCIEVDGSTEWGLQYQIKQHQQQQYQQPQYRQQHQQLGCGSPCDGDAYLKSRWAACGGRWYNSNNNTSAIAEANSSLTRHQDDAWLQKNISDDKSRAAAGMWPQLGQPSIDSSWDQSQNQNRNRNLQTQDSPSTVTLPVLTKPYAAVVNPQRGWKPNTNNNINNNNKNNTQCRAATKSAPVAWNNRQVRSTQQQQQQQQQHHRSRVQQPQQQSQQQSQRQMQQPQWHHPAVGGSVMRAVFLGSDRSSTGTGVFLPRCAGVANDFKRKPACSSVLLPSRVIEVLNLNVEDMRCQAAAAAAAASSSSAAAAAASPGDEGQWKTYSMCSSQLHLPTEWSY